MLPNYLAMPGCVFTVKRVACSLNGPNLAKRNQVTFLQKRVASFNEANIYILISLKLDFQIYTILPKYKNLPKVSSIPNLDLTFIFCI